MRFLFSVLPERFRVLWNVLHNQGSSRNDVPPGCVPSSSSVRIPLKTSVSVPSTSAGPSRVPLTSEDLPLLSQWRHDWITGVPPLSTELGNTSLDHAARVLSSSEGVPPENMMSLCYRFMPNQTTFLWHHFVVSKSLKNRLTKICNSIGLTTSNCIPYYVPEVIVYSRLGNGLRSLVNQNDDKVVVELLSFDKGKYGRIVILVSMGVSCTVWYLFVPGVADVAPPLDLFPRFESYRDFLNPDNHFDWFRKFCFIERTYKTDEIFMTLENELPFSDINIPATGSKRIAVGLGFMIGVFLAMGIVPFTDSVPANLFE